MSCICCPLCVRACERLQPDRQWTCQPSPPHALGKAAWHFECCRMCSSSPGVIAVLLCSQSRAIPELSLLVPHCFAYALWAALHLWDVTALHPLQDVISLWGCHCLQDGLLPRGGGHCFSECTAECMGPYLGRCSHSPSLMFWPWMAICSTDRCQRCFQAHQN